MHRPGANPDNMQMADFLCDFCGAVWTDSRPMVEGHQGHAICGDCLARAYRCLVLKAGDPAGPPGAVCLMCMERRDEPLWGPRDGGAAARICTRCARQSAAVLAKEKELGWVKPTE
jgi:hypothetical protein